MAKLPLVAASLALASLTLAQDKTATDAVLPVHQPAPVEPDPALLAVESVVGDYIDAFYEVDPQRIRTSVHEDVVKFGFYLSRSDGGYEERPMSFPQLLDLARSLNQADWVPSDAARTIEIFDVMERTATAKLTAVWGVDYLHLAKIEGRWQIVHILWESLPEPPEDE